MTGTDPYLPGHGDAGFGVDHYDLDLAYKPAGNRLEAEAVLTCTAADDLDALQLDLDGLKVSRLLVDGARPAKFGQSSGRLRVKLAETIEAGEGFEIRIKYAGSPTPVRSRKLGTAGWEELEDGVIVAAQPHGAPSWFPCNDRPDDKATYRLRISCPAEYYVAVSGELDSAQRSGASTVWTYRMERPMATYLATVQIGQYALREQDAEVPMRVVAPREVRGEGYDLSFGRQPEMMAFFTDAFGPYPFPGYTTVITADELEIPLESQSLSTFGSNFASGEWDCVRLVAHEMAHQWFGNAVTLRHWRDIWLHEGFACYAEWLWSEESGAGTADERAAHHHGRLVELPQDLLLSDPGPADMFDDRVYKRGALTLHALRARVGDDAFFGTLQTWVRDFDGASVTTEEFVAHAEEVCGSELGDLFEAWLYRTELPDLPVLSGDFEPEETS